MRKKLVSIVVTLGMVFSLFACMGITALGAEDVEHIKNGSFSEITRKSITGWGAKGGTVGEEVVASPDGARTDNAVRLRPNGTGVFVAQTLTRLIPGETYHVSGWVKIMELTGNNAGIKIEWSGGKAEKYIGKAEADGVWTEMTFSFTPPEGVTAASILVRNTSNGGDVYWDDISVKGPKNPVVPSAEKDAPKDDMPAYVPMPSGSHELLRNGNFEAVTDDGIGISNWQPSISWSKETADATISVSNVAHTGQTSLHITARSANPYIKQNVYDPVAGATYQASLWYKIDSDKAEPGIKIEWYRTDPETGANVCINGVWAQTARSATNGWMQYVYHFTVPENCTFFTYYVRSYTSSKAVAPYDVYFDDVSCYIIKDAPKNPVKLTTDEVFYYSDMTEGRASIRPDFESFPSLTAVEMRLRDEAGNVLEAKTISPKQDTWRFKLAPMTEKKTYLVEAIAKDAAGTTLGTVSKVVHKYPRPEMLSKDGTILVDGKPFYPTFVYHMYLRDLPYAASIGANVSQVQGSSSLAAMKEYCDEAHKYGIKCIVPLYAGGHPDRVANTTEIVNGLKDHPAVLAWMVADEATSNYADDWDLFHDTYKLFRDLDDVHPVYILQNVPDQFSEVGKYADILAYDPYPPANRKATHIANHTTQAVEAVEYEKPVWCLNKAYARLVEELPTVMEERSFWYQALFAGASAVGYYSYSDAIVEPDILPMHDTYEPKLVAFYEGLQEFAKAEMAESYEVFLEHKYPIFAENRDENSDVWYKAYVKDGKVRYILLNRHQEETSVSIPLVSDGGMKIGAFSASCIYGGAEAASGSGTLNLTLEPCAAYVYEITPSEAIDLSGILTTKFHDIGKAPWASEAIRRMEEKGVILGTSPMAYSHDENITRADFAMFLINALGLTSESGENFADVASDAYYAKALATGRALGILKGVGENCFNPYAEISRQDMMVICARGLRLTGKLGKAGTAENVANFTDAASIADYAVEDVSAMVRENIIRGNADGTINPLGNTTRAEAAVLMDRIYTK